MLSIFAIISSVLVSQNTVHMYCMTSMIVSDIHENCKTNVH